MQKSGKFLNKKKQRKEEDSGEEQSLESQEDISYEKAKDSGKKSKSDNISKSKSKKEEDDDIIVGDDEVTIMLNKKKRLNIRKFKGNVLVDIREFWTNNDGKWLPGKKGISLTVENWNKIKEHIDDIDSAIQNMK